MTTIFDRCRIDISVMPNVDNAHAHSAEIASLAARVAAAAYAFTHEIDPNAKSLTESKHNIPFESLKFYLPSDKEMLEREWYGPEGERNTFVVSVIGGAAYGILIKNFIFIGFRGTTNIEDWAINLFGLGWGGVFKCPIGFDYYIRKRDRYFREYSRFCVHTKNINARVHAGFYRVSQALCQQVRDEIDKLKEKYEKQGGKDEICIILTGHSLGGALALLSGLWIDHQAVYTFGMPRVCEGNLVPELPACHYRYELEGDSVPNFPSELLGFRHDMPSLRLNPYRDLQKPNLLAKAIGGLRKGVTLAGSVRTAAKAILASEHDMELYVKSVMPKSTLDNNQES